MEVFFGELPELTCAHRASTPRWCAKFSFGSALWGAARWRQAKAQAGYPGACAGSYNTQRPSGRVGASVRRRGVGGVRGGRMITHIGCWHLIAHQAVMTLAASPPPSPTGTATAAWIRTVFLLRPGWEWCRILRRSTGATSGTTAARPTATTKRATATAHARARACVCARLATAPARLGGSVPCTAQPR